MTTPYGNVLAPITPYGNAIAAAMGAAAKSPCMKSRRGAAAFFADEVLATGFNGPPGGIECDGSAECRADCNKRCVHAEMRVLRPFQRLPEQVTARIEIVHVKIDTAGSLVAGGGPSCWQCSREVLDVGVGGVWLYEMPQLGTIGGPGPGFVAEWRFYDAHEFHRVTLEACKISVRPLQ